VVFPACLGETEDHLSWQANVRFAAHNGLWSDIAPRPFCDSGHAPTSATGPFGAKPKKKPPKGGSEFNLLILGQSNI
jgi:hypothetical protein